MRYYARFAAFLGLWSCLPGSAFGQTEAAPVTAPEAATAPATELKRIVLLNMAGSGALADLAASLSEVLIGAIREAAPQAQVIGQSEISAMLNLEKQKDVVGCSDNTSCLAEIGGALGADHLVTGTIGKVGALYLINIRLIDTGKARVVRAIAERVEGRDELVVEAVTQFGRQLVDPTRPTRLGFLTCREPGRLIIDEASPVASPVLKLPVPAGLHTARLVDSKSGALRFETSIEVPAYDVVVLEVPKAPAALTTLPPAASGSGGTGSDGAPGGAGPGGAAVVATADEPGAWYTSWWFWTIVGVAVVVGAGGAYFALGGSSPLGSDDTVSGTVHVSLNP